MILNKLLKSVRDIEEVSIKESDGKFVFHTKSDDGITLLNKYSIYQYSIVDNFEIKDKTIFITLKKEGKQ